MKFKRNLLYIQNSSFPQVIVDGLDHTGLRPSARPKCCHIFSQQFCCNFRGECWQFINCRKWPKETTVTNLSDTCYSAPSWYLHHSGLWYRHRPCLISSIEYSQMEAQRRVSLTSVYHANLRQVRSDYVALCTARRWSYQMDPAAHQAMEGDIYGQVILRIPQNYSSKITHLWMMNKDISTRTHQEMRYRTWTFV